jgi:hypothetical protein
VIGRSFLGSYLTPALKRRTKKYKRVMDLPVEPSMANTRCSELSSCQRFRNHLTSDRSGREYVISGYFLPGTVE